MTVHLVTAGAEQFTANAYLVPGERTTLVDVGTVPDVVERLRGKLGEPDDREAGTTSTSQSPDGSLDAVVLTHQHRDHVATLDAVCDAFDPDVYAYAPHPLRTHSLADGEAIAIGDETHRVVHTPGHADDHVALVGERLLFSGDVVVYNDGAFDDGSFGRTDRPGQSREALIDSLERLLDTLPESVTAMYPGHGDPFHESGDDEVADVIGRALRRAERREPKYD